MPRTCIVCSIVDLDVHPGLVRWIDDAAVRDGEGRPMRWVPGDACRDRIACRDRVLAEPPIIDPATGRVIEPEWIVDDGQPRTDRPVAVDTDPAPGQDTQTAPPADTTPVGVQRLAAAGRAAPPGRPAANTPTEDWFA